jgi:hypothetical protein
MAALARGNPEGGIIRDAMTRAHDFFGVLSVHHLVVRQRKSRTAKGELAVRLPLPSRQRLSI